MEFKNVQRRVYDVLNVLSALNIVHKVKNTIYYKENDKTLNSFKKDL